MELGQQLKRELETAPDDFLNVLKQAETEFSKPADEKDKVGEVPDTNEMQAALRNLISKPDKKPSRFINLVGEDNFRALIVSPDGIKAISSPIKGTELNEKALKLWGLLQSDRYDTTVLSKENLRCRFRTDRKRIAERYDDDYVEFGRQSAVSADGGSCLTGSGF